MSQQGREARRRLLRLQMMTKKRPMAKFLKINGLPYFNGKISLIMAHGSVNKYLSSTILMLIVFFNLIHSYIYEADYYIWMRFQGLQVVLLALAGRVRVNHWINNFLFNFFFSFCIINMALFEIRQTHLNAIWSACIFALSGVIAITIEKWNS